MSLIFLTAGARLATADKRGMTPLSLTATLGKRTGEKIRLALVECAKRRDEVSFVYLVFSIVVAEPSKRCSYYAVNVSFESTFS